MIRDNVLLLLRLPGIVVPGKRRLRRAFALYSQWKRQREGFFEQMRKTDERANLSEAEAIRLTDEAKRAVRSQP